MGCNRKEKIRVQQTEEEGATLASMVHMADPQAGSQLVSGFYDIEQNAWRWTAGKFAVVLKTPRGASSAGAMLQFKFSVPDAVLAKLKTVSLDAKVNGKSLSPESYTQPGEFVYSRDIPASLLTGNSVRVDFALDKCLSPGEVDQRELGVIASSIGLEPK
ncbi:MAG: hypothetical protein M1541_21670 [Acidobacteria bacterium]|nr:hypothetical protein [Acidobacteriota bacterium]